MPFCQSHGLYLNSFLWYCAQMVDVSSQVVKFVLQEPPLQLVSWIYYYYYYYYYYYVKQTSVVTWLDIRWSQLFANSKPVHWYITCESMNKSSNKKEMTDRPRSEENFCKGFTAQSTQTWSCQVRLVYLTTLLLGRFSSLSGQPVLCTFFSQKLTIVRHESAEGKQWP